MNSPSQGFSEPHAVRSESTTFVVLLGLYAIILFPILRADRYYNDDLKRALFGHASWDSNGRPLTTFLMRALQAYDHAMVDLSPLTQIGAVAVLAWAGWLLARRYGLRSPWMAALATFPLGAQPFYLENLSYKFDALSMSLAMLLAIVPIVQGQRTRASWWLGVLALFASLNFYQPAIDVYLVFALMEVVLAQLQGTSVDALGKRALSRALQLVVTMTLYELIVGIHISGWVRRQATPIHPGQWRQLYLNYLDFYRFIGASFNEHWWVAYAPALLVLGGLPVVIGLRYAARQRATCSRLVCTLLGLFALLVPLLASVLAIGPMLTLAAPEITPRVLMGVGAMLTSSLLILGVSFGAWGRSPRWFAVLAGWLALGMASVASAYGNAQGEQRGYEAHIGARLADDIAQLKATRGVDAVLIEGSDGYAPVTAHVVEQVPLVRTLIAPYIAGGNTFQTRSFLAFYLKGVTDLDELTDPVTLRSNARLIAAVAQQPAVVTTSSYRLYVEGHAVIVKFD